MNTERDEDFMENGCHNCSHLHYVKGEESMFCDVRERMLPVDSWTSAANHCGGWKESEEEEIDERNCVNCVHSHAVNGEEGVLCDVCGKMLGDAGNWDIFAKDCADYVNENQQHQIRIDEEFKALIPPLSNEERESLEGSIVADGCRDSLVLWDGVLIDGHHRHEICTRLGIEFNTVEMANLETRNDARLWIIRNQLGRRNLTNYQRAELVLKLKPAIAEKAKENLATHTEQGYQKSGKAVVVDKELSMASGLSHDTISKADFIGQHADEETKQALRTGETSINREYKRIKHNDELKEREQMLIAQRGEKGDPATIVKMDSLTFLEGLDLESADLLLTDPPYMTDVEDIKAFSASWVPIALDRVKSTGRAYICAGAYPREIQAYLSVLLEQSRFTLENILVWTYRNTLGPSPAMAYKMNWQAIFYLRGEDAEPLSCPVMVEQFSVQDINAPDARMGVRYHSWEKPMELADRFIRHSTKAGDIVIDPFAGTGTFLLAAAEIGRKAMGCDNDDVMLSMAMERGCKRAYRS